MNIYVGNLSWQMTDEDLRTLFEQYGSVTSAKIVKDNKEAVKLWRRDYQKGWAPSV